MIIAVAAYAVSRSLPATAAFAGIVLLASAWSNVRFFADVRRRDKSQADPRAIEVIEVQSFRVLDIEHFGSHGPAWVFFADEKKALLLVGQWLLRQRSFPSTSFRLIRWTDTKEPIRIESIGARIKPEHTTVQVRTGYRVTDVEMFGATPETLQHDLDEAFGTKKPNQPPEPMPLKRHGSS